MAEYISVSEALKLVSPFKGERKEVLAFISNVDTPFQVINPDNAAVLYKFVLTRISAETRAAITHRNLKRWADLRKCLRNTYTEKCTLDFHATQLFGARQGSNESVVNIGARVKFFFKFLFMTYALCNNDIGIRFG